MPAPTTLATLLLTAGAPVPAEELARWSDAERDAAREWIENARVQAMGWPIVVRVPPHLRPFLLEGVA